MITLLNDDSFVVAIPMITVADDVTVAVPVTISVTLTNRYASTANTNPDLFRSSRHCAANSSYGGDHYGILNHCVLLSLLNPGGQSLDAGIVPVRRPKELLSFHRQRRLCPTRWSILLTFRNGPLPNLI
jgi:hypothetical protein